VSNGNLISNDISQITVQETSSKLLELGVDIVREGVKNVSGSSATRHQLSLSHGQSSVFNFLLTSFRVLIFLILIIYISKIKDA